MQVSGGGDAQSAANSAATAIGTAVAHAYVSAAATVDVQGKTLLQADVPQGADLQCNDAASILFSLRYPGQQQQQDSLSQVNLCFVCAGSGEGTVSINSQAESVATVCQLPCDERPQSCIIRTCYPKSCIPHDASKAALQS